MTDNEIIKALECCAIQGGCVPDCPGKKVGCEIEQYAIDLINRQKAQIERLKKGWTADIVLTADAKAEAIKEFAERLKEKSSNYCLGVDGVCTMVDVDDIDDIVKEMTE